MRTTDLSKRPWRSLSPQNKKDRLLVIEVLRRLKKGEKFGTIMKDIGVSKDLIRKHASSYVSEDDLNG
jgi:hypothetical protein